MQAGEVSHPVAPRTERVAVDLTGVEVDQPVRVGVLELQYGLFDFSRRGSDLDGDAVLCGRGYRRAPFAVWLNGDFGAAARLVAYVEVHGKGAVVDDVGVSEGGGGEVGDVCLCGGNGAEGRDGRSSCDGCSAGGELDRDVAGLAGGRA